MCAGREPRHYLNGSHFLACRHFSEAAISAQTDRQGGDGGGGGGGGGVLRGTQGYVLPDVED